MGRFTLELHPRYCTFLCHLESHRVKSRACSISGLFDSKRGHRAWSALRVGGHVRNPKSLTVACEQCLEPHFRVSDLRFRRMSVPSCADNNNSCRDSHKSADCHLRYGDQRSGLRPLRS